LSIRRPKCLGSRRLSPKKKLKIAVGKVWQAYRDKAEAGKWAEEFPVKDGGMEAWVKEKQIQPLIADLGEKKMPYVIARMADDGGPLGRLLRDGSCRTSQ
jgi:hypothetical protein